MELQPPPTKPVEAKRISPPAKVPFGVNEMRLNAKQWIAVFLAVLVVVETVPLVWRHIEKFKTGPDYRIPYSLSKDYWLFNRRMRQAAQGHKIILLGDSVIWGEYVLPDGTLSHFLNREAGVSNLFINGGINGLFPLAEEGLFKYYGQPLRNQKILLHCNLLWMTSPKADLSAQKEEQFNHASLVPQFYPRIPCYKVGANDRLSIVVEREVPFLWWVAHLQNAFFDQRSILHWTLEDNGGDPPQYPNVYKNPLSQISLTVPSAPKHDPLRGPQSPRHKPWFKTTRQPMHFDWVGAKSSLQWHAFQRVVLGLRARGNHVLVILGPFNEHLVAEESRPAYHQIHQAIEAWLQQEKIPAVAPQTLPSALYADASHPLTEGYQLLAEQIFQDRTFREWMKR
jgi:hypothetical protein